MGLEDEIAEHNNSLQEQIDDLIMRLEIAKTEIDRLQKQLDNQTPEYTQPKQRQMG